jgi:hypothetical protein
VVVLQGSTQSYKKKREASHICVRKVQWTLGLLSNNKNNMKTKWISVLVILLYLISEWCIVEAGKDYYSILGVSRDATQVLKVPKLPLTSPIESN